jgi:hypothetical protein
MKRSFIIILVVLLNLAQVSAQNTYTARVVDETTDDALPLASVYISASRSTITNQEGDFSIQADPNDMLRISYVGYNAKNIKASDLGSTVKLKPYAKMLQEVTVTPIDVVGLLKKLMKKLKMEYAQFHFEQSNYFYRQVSSNDTTYNELIEAFFRSQSDIALRNFMLTTGRYGNIESSDTLKPFYKFRNYYVTSSLAPILPDPGVWKELFVPLPYKWAKNYYDGLYNLSYAILRGDDDTKVIMVEFGETSKASSHVMTGRLTFDMDKLQLLSFRGKVHNEPVRVRYRKSGSTSMFRYCLRDIEIQMTYKHDRGFDEVASIGTRMVVNRGKDEYNSVYWSTMFNIGNYDIGKGTSTYKEDIYKALSLRGNDEAFRKHYKIVKTTSTEEGIIKKLERDGCFGNFTR